MNAKILRFVICAEEIKYLLLYNMHDCNFKVYDAVSYLNNNNVLFDILRREKYDTETLSINRVLRKKDF